tara:strand:- start:117 stop:401 length:285 start_codon:yes stop_codon:yes gene_type:complete
MSPYVAGKKTKKFDNTLEYIEFIKIKNEVKNIKKFLKKNFEFVGEKFPEEVRDIYYGNKKNKNIYGTVSSTERKELEEEGIALTSVPWMKDEEN